MTHVSRRLATLAVAVVVALAGWRLIAGRGSGNDAAPPPPPVTAAPAQQRDVPLFLTGVGTVQAYNTVTVRVRVDGELVSVPFREGQDVRKGDLLAQIDPRPYQAALDNALAILAKDEATLANARRDLERYQGTASRGYTPRQQLDQQTATVASLSAAVQADKAMVENARVQLGYTNILSPLDGRTGIRLIDQGNIVRAGDQTGLVVITQQQPISVVFTLPQARLTQVLDAQEKGPLAVTALTADGASELAQGRLELVDNQIDPATGTFRLKATFANERRRLWPGEFVTARLQTGLVAGGVTVEARAVQRGDKGSYAYVVKADDTAELRQLKVGDELDGQILVTEGLQPGERVIVDGQLRVRPGGKVQVVAGGGTQSAAAGTPAP
jgi:multidrug efflux system membrane fusion protein